MSSAGLHRPRTFVRTGTYQTAVNKYYVGYYRILAVSFVVPLTISTTPASGLRLWKFCKILQQYTEQICQSLYTQAASHVALLVNHGEYADGTDGRTDARPLHYV